MKFPFNIIQHCVHDESMVKHLSPKILKPGWQYDMASQCPMAFMRAN